MYILEYSHGFSLLNPIKASLTSCFKGMSCFEGMSCFSEAQTRQLCASCYSGTGEAPGRARVCVCVLVVDERCAWNNLLSL